MSVTWVLAWRNLWRHRRRTWLTVGAMVFCNTLLVFLVSLQVGSYDMMINASLSAFTGHLQVQHEAYREEQHIYQGVPEAAALAARLRAAPWVDAAAARAEAFALASSEERSFGVLLTGVQPAYEPGVSTFPAMVRRGRYLQDGHAAEVVMGSVLAQNLKLAPGDEVTFLGTGRDGSFAAAVATVVGILDTGLEEVDRNLVQIPLGWFQEVFAMGGEGHSVVLRVPGLDRVDAAVAQLRGLLPAGQHLTVLDWEALMPGLRQTIESDIASAWFMYGVLVILVAFSVLNTQLMSVLERTHEFGVIMALGMRPSRLARLVLLETLLMSAVGLGLGALLGGLLTTWLGYTGVTFPGMEDMASRFMLPEYIYPRLTPLSLLVGPLAVFLAALLAAVYPALRLFALQPVAAMRAA